MLNNHNDEYDHCYSLSNIRTWCQPITTATRANVAGYCDYCTKLKSSSNESKSKSLVHLNECRNSFIIKQLIINQKTILKIIYNMILNQNNIFVNYVFTKWIIILK